MAIIPKINVRSYNTETETVVSMFLVELLKLDLTMDPYLLNLVSDAEVSNGLLSRSIDREKFKSFLDKRMKVRQNAFRCISFTVKGATYHSDEEKANSALIIQKVVNNFGHKIFRDNQSKQSAEFKTFIGNLTEESLKPHIDNIPGLSTCISNLIVSHNDCMDYWQSLENVKAEEDSKESATQLKNKLLCAVNQKLIHYLNAMVDSQPAVYGMLAKPICEIIQNHNFKIKQRQKRSKSKE